MKNFIYVCVNSVLEWKTVKHESMIADTVAKKFTEIPRKPDLFASAVENGEKKLFHVVESAWRVV